MDINGKSWNVLPLGCGGLVRGFSVSNDGTVVCRTDVGNAYLWSGVLSVASVSDAAKMWIPLVTFSSMPAGTSTKFYGVTGVTELVVSPSNSNVAYMMVYDDGGTYKWSIYYTTNLKSAPNHKWIKTDLALFDGADPTFAICYANYKIAVDPNNDQNVIVGLPTNSGKSYAVWKSSNRANFTAVTSCGDATYGDGVSGICFNGSSRVVVPVPGNDIFQSTDSLATFSSTGFAAAYGQTSFFVRTAVMNPNGVYYASVYSNLGLSIWRLASGTWTKIRDLGTNAGTDLHLVLDPANNSKLIQFGLNGIGIGYYSLNADSGTPTWTGSTSGERATLTAPAYDIGYLNYIFGQDQGGNNAFTYACHAIIDANGVWWWCGNQSIWYFSSKPDYSQNPCYSTSVSFGRGMEATVAQDVYCPRGGPYPIIGVQDLGGALRGTFSSYPVDIFDRYVEYTCENVDEAADGSIVVIRATGQAGSSADISAYSTSYGADGSWTKPATTPTSLWQAVVVGGVSNGSGSAGSILNITGITSGVVQNNQNVTGSGLSASHTYRVQPNGGGSGGTGTYLLQMQQANGSYAAASELIAPGTSLTLSKAIQGGQTIAVDKDHWLTCPSGYSQGYIPAYTANATSGGCTWSLTDLPDANWMMRSWVFGQTNKPFAAGFGTDLGTVWAALGGAAGTTYIYKSTNSGATFGSSISSVSMSASMIGIYLLAVPGYPGELWLSGSFTGGSPTGLWHSTNGGTSFTAVTMPGGNGAALALTIGSPKTAGGYPTLYMLCWASYGATKYLYEGQWNGSTMTWSLFGPTGTSADLPPVAQICGIGAIRGDFNQYQRLYVATNQCGYAFYSPGRQSTALLGVHH